MKLNEKEKELENSENQSNVIALSDVDRADRYPDWLTPMNRLCKFVCTEIDRFHTGVYLLVFTKIINHEHCVELIEHSAWSDQAERSIYVNAKEFCKKYLLVEIVDEFTGTI